MSQPVDIDVMYAAECQVNKNRKVRLSSTIKHDNVTLRLSLETASEGDSLGRAKRVRVPTDRCPRPYEIESGSRT